MSYSENKKSRRNTWVTVKTSLSAPNARNVKKTVSSPNLPLPHYLGSGSRLASRSQAADQERRASGRKGSNALYSLAGLIKTSDLYGHSKSARSFPRPLISSFSENDLGVKEKRNADRIWKLSLLMTKAKRRLSIPEIDAEESRYKNPLLRKTSMKQFWKAAANMKATETDKRKMIRELKRKAQMHKRRLIAKFKLAVRLTIVCSRLFKEHCLRINEQNDDLAPYIRRLHFHEEDSSDLLIDLTKFKANRQMRIPEETKRILSMEVSERSEKEVYTVTLALRNIKCFAEYPKRMQNKLAEVGLYEKYESKRVIVRQGHPASAFYFILSGAVVVMVMDEDSKYARPVAHLYKGQTFGELAIINGTQRNSTVIAKETCEFMSISQKDYNKIFMAGGVKNINDPDQEIFLKSLHCLAGWPIHIMQHHLHKCQFLFFKNGEVIVRDSHYSDWVIIVKSGSIRVLKKLKRVEAFEWKKKQPMEPLTNSTRRDIVLKRTEWRRVLPELGIPLQNRSASENVTEFLGNGKPVPFIHPDQEDDESETTRSEQSGKKAPQIPNLWPFKVNLAEIESGRYLEDHRDLKLPPRLLVSKTDPGDSSRDNTFGRRLNNRLSVNQNMLGRDRRKSVVEEEERELLGYQPHIRTIMEDIDGGINKKDDDAKPADMNPEFVHVQTLTKGQVFGLTDLIIGDQPSFSVVSHGADCLLINKNFYLEHASEKLLRDMRQELCPYPTEEELQERLQVSVDWQAYKKTMLIESVENVSTKRLMRSSLKGTKTQESFAY